MIKLWLCGDGPLLGRVTKIDALPAINERLVAKCVKRRVRYECKAKYNVVNMNSISIVLLESVVEANVIQLSDTNSAFLHNV